MHSIMQRQAGGTCAQFCREVEPGNVMVATYKSAGTQCHYEQGAHTLLHNRTGCRTGSTSVFHVHVSGSMRHMRRAELRGI
jgi:hypothetical protein